jgi:hypothetical protein
MTILQRAARPSLAILAGLCLHNEAEAIQPTPVVTTRQRVLQTVNQALVRSDRGEFIEARQSLEQSLAGCGTAPDGRECRVLFASGLGSMLQRQASVDRRNRDSLYTRAVAYYDKILTEVPNNPEAIYGKALAYRALGSHEWQETFFRQAPSLDPGKSALYLTFQGDYFASVRRWPDAAQAYRQAVQQDADDDGARSGLIEALSTLGSQSTRELLGYARDWELRYPASAAAAYRAILSASFAPSGQRDAVADSAIIGLVSVQSQNRLAVGTMPASVSPDWTPVREIHAFLRTATSPVAPWWQQNPERTKVLAQAALAGGRAAVGEGKYNLAENLWRDALNIAQRNSTVSLDLQRELALLYSRQPTLDPDRRKFNSLEQNIFEGKMGALATGDLEAAQRYHTTLGLIYLERGVWRNSDYARNAEKQITWALDKAEEREQRQRFYQPLAELRLILARGLDSTGDRGAAARRYAEAARAFLDVDDLEAATNAARNATRLDGNVAGVMPLVALRSELARGPAGARACTSEQLGALRRTGDVAFVNRQRFKVLADCSKADATTRQRQHAMDAFTLVDSARVTLVSGADVVRFERVMQTLLTPFSVRFEAVHLDPAPVTDQRSIQVSLPAETTPLWYSPTTDNVLVARVVTALGNAVRPFPMMVAGGVVSIPPSVELPSTVLAKLRGVAGVRAVQRREWSY